MKEVEVVDIPIDDSFELLQKYVSRLHLLESGVLPQGLPLLLWNLGQLADFVEDLFRGAGENIFESWKIFGERFDESALVDFGKPHHRDFVHLLEVGHFVKIKL